jgi:hypothetical protein
MVDDVLVSKIAPIEESIRRIRVVYVGNDRNLYDDPIRQDSR